MLKRLWRALTGPAATPPAPREPIMHAGFMIYPEPQAEGGQYRLAGRICKEMDGTLHTHRFVRSDLFAQASDAEALMLQKAQRFIDETGEAMFAPHTPPKP
ncbi:MAG: HlyU family transcriptional regulator [Aeromonas sp.]